MNSDFVHLHVHTMYSLLDGAIRPDRLLVRAGEFGMHAVAITDHGTMFNVLEFYYAAKKAGIKPIIGCECYVAPRRLTDKNPQDAKGVRHLVLLAENMEGYQNLCRLVTLAQTDGFYYRPRIDKHVLRRYSGGLIGMSACLHGEIPMLITAGRLEEAEKAALEYQEIFGAGNFFLEVQNNGIDSQDIVNSALRDMSGKLSIPLVASNDCHYLDKDDVRAHDVLLCVQTGKTVEDSNRFRFRTDQLYFKSKEEMIDYFSTFPGAVENTVAIAERCNVALEFEGYHFPKFEDPSGLDTERLFIRKSHEGFERVWARIKARNPAAAETVYRDRLAYEIGVITKMGFPGYFLIVSDFIGYAKRNNIPVGPGRGSAAGSLVAFSLGITDLDPLQHGLLFERFLNPERISMPDIDVDFCIAGRENVFRYVVERYGGSDYVAQIITFGKLKTRLVIRDVGRALNIPLSEVDAIAKLVPEQLNITLDEALEKEPRLRELQTSRPDVAELIDICRTLEGLPRHASTHAAGVVIGDRPLVEYLPLFKGKKGEIVTQFDMKMVEKIGLVKFDFLGLRNLTVIADTLKLIEQQGKMPPDLSNLDFNDQATYELLAAGDTTGVFQLESAGMKGLLIRMRPECFDDVTALVALYRPGPLDSGMVDDFVERKHGRKAVEYLLPVLEPILKETYGVIVYQEQVMKIASALASYSMAEADNLRKAMGKKDADLMARMRQRFVEGCIGNGIEEEKAVTLFDLMEKFGRYGFNKSHSAAYALIALQTAFLKAHYPLEFIAALLTSEMQSIDGVVKFINECRSHDIEVLPPDINHSGVNFTVEEDKIRFGLAAVKNVGESAVEAIVAERTANGPYKSIYDFCERVDLRKVNKRVVEGLIACGAFDGTQAGRAAAMAVLEELLEYGQKVQKERCDPQMGLFDEGPGCGASVTRPTLPVMEEWNPKERLEREKDSLGFYISGHPLDPHKKTMAKFCNMLTLAVDEAEDGLIVRMGGMVVAKKVIRTRKEEPMAFVQLEDRHGQIEVVLFPAVYAQCGELLNEERPVLVQGRLQKGDKGCKLLADTVIAMENAESLWTAEVHFNIDVDGLDQEKLNHLSRIVRRYPGECNGILHLKIQEGLETVIAMSDQWGIQPGERFFNEVNGLLGRAAVETCCSAIAAAPSNGNGRRNGSGVR